ncbi:HK97 family phage prohead protease [Aquamicrobium segne]|uniref:HK97 family phage prohead protease n=1 Tax=Aquamicrobium segne TaxID=469547 RepID=A0ABW0GVS9_9HYPH
MTTDPARKQLERKFADLAVDRVEADGHFCGYASLFGIVDLGKDVVEPGAFSRSLRQRKISGIRMLYQHNAEQPIGIWTEIREDRRGLFVRGQLTPGVQRATEVLALLRSGALDGLSIGFKAQRTRRNVTRGIRHIIEADLWEISVVTFPMQPAARIASVKARPQQKPAGPKTGGKDTGLQQLAAEIYHAIHIINPKGRSL